MSYLKQAYKGDSKIWKYLIIPFLFFGFAGLNLLLTANIDVEAIIKSEIAKKGENRFLAENMIPLAVGLLLIFGYVKYIHKRSITSLTTSRKKIDWKRVFFSFGVWALITAIFVGIDYTLHPENYQWNFKLIPFLILCVIGISLIPLQTSFEEYFFRGYLMQGIGIACKNRWLPLFFTSITFGLLHFGNPEVAKLGNTILLYYVGTGFFLGIITLMDEGLELALGFHAANNLITALLVTADWTAFQTNSVLKDISKPSIGIDVFVPLLIIFPLLLFIFSKKYRWKNWKKKLFGKI